MKKLLIALCLAIFSLNALAAKPQKEFERFATTMVKRFHFDKKEVVKLLQQAEEVRPIQQHIATPVTNLPWYKFKPLFVNQRRIDNGVKFWDENKEVLDRAATTYGIPASIIVSVIGVETKYGETIGNFRTFDALTTLAFYTPKARQEYFRTELIEFMLLAREQGWQPRDVLGSYAGALGLPQFMPSSYRIYAVDFDSDGKIDLMHNVTDAIGSVGAYLQRKGWVHDQEIVKQSDCKSLPEGYVKRIRPTIKMIEWASKCRVIVVDADDFSYYNYPASLFQIEIEEGEMEFLNGFDNFYAIFRYNPSVNYCMAVITLSQELEIARKQRSE